MKATLREIKKNPLGTNREDKEDRAQSNNVEHMEEINSQPVQNEETRIQKNEDKIRRLWDISKCANIRIIGMPEGEQEEHEIEILFEKIMKENIPNLVKEIDIQIQEVQRVPNKLNSKRPTPRHNIIKKAKG